MNYIRNKVNPLFIEYTEYTECQLCPHYCRIHDGKTGICGARRNVNGRIEPATYGIVSGRSLDPIEKKPLYHFFPGSNIYSIGSYGCNLKCDFCQNYNISQSTLPGYFNKTAPETIIAEANSSLNNIGIAFTYNEPLIGFEYMRDVSYMAKEKGLHTVMVSNGYINNDPLEEIITFIDAFNIDLKAFNNDFYKKLTGADIEPVKNSLKRISKAGRHLEITTLIIPGQNDSPKEIELQSEWIAGELGKDIPLHISRYFPMFKREDPATSPEVLKKLADIASKELSFVYLGNLASKKGQDTFCPGCGKIVTVRSGYNTRLTNLDKDGACSTCGTPVYEYFTSFPSLIRN